MPLAIDVFTGGPRVGQGIHICSFNQYASRFGKKRGITCLWLARLNPWVSLDPPQGIIDTPLRHGDDGASLLILANELPHAFGIRLSCRIAHQGLVCRFEGVMVGMAQNVEQTIEYRSRLLDAPLEG